MAFSGFPNAADVAVRAARHIRQTLNGTKLGEIRLDGYCDCTVARPIVSIKDGMIDSLQLPATELHACVVPDAGRDVIVASGPEPHFRWRQYAAAMLKLAERFGVTTIVSTGGLYDSVPHTRPVRVSGLVNQPELRQRLDAIDIRPSSYTGPSSFHTTLLRACAERGLPGASLWGHAPAYAQVEWNPVITHALLRAVGAFLGVELPLEPLGRAVTRFNEALDEFARANAELSLLIKKLEQEYDRVAPPAEESSSPSAPLSEGVLRDIMDILRRTDGEDPHPAPPDSP